ncbi:MAG TPA: glycoside hydrolase family 2 TIM barrel-domain containing protein [Vicinamibacteria bacterium]|nr:glycoside hydrolase family 2 TIM barrel-domain containing protein [Vicinamibacteria bacterium]
MRSAIAAGAIVALGACAGPPAVQPTAAPATGASPRERTPLATSWRFHASGELVGAEAPGFDDTGWQAVTVPHTWGPEPRRGAWYRARFTVEAPDPDRRVYVSFEGVATRADVYVNGHNLGRHLGAYTAFTFDATPAVVPGTNVVAVRVSNHPQDTVDSLPSGAGKQLYRTYGGIYRKAWLLTTRSAHFDPLDHGSSGVYVTTSNVTAASADLAVRARVGNASGVPMSLRFYVRLIDRDGQFREGEWRKVEVPPGQAVEASVSHRVSKPHLWSIATPYLYTLRAELWDGDRLVDALTERIGFRDFRLQDGRFLLNGEPILLRGVGKHQETESHLSAVTDDELREDFASLKDLGVNFVRLAHYPHARLEYDLADELGLLVWAENGHSNSWKVDPASGETITREMVRQHGNHPSIVMWSVGNETAFVRVNPFAAAAKSDDPQRLVVYASNTGVQGRKRQPNLDLIAHNTYRGWYRGEPWEFEERAVALRYVAESGGGSVITNHTDHLAARHVVDAFEPEEYRQELAEVHFQTVFRDHAQDVPLYIVWILRDFGIDKYKGRNTKGLLTAANFRKDAYYLYRSFLRPDEPTVHIASATRFLRTGRPDDGIKAYSNRPSLRLSLNDGPPIAQDNGAFRHRNGRRIDNVFHWRVSLREGRNVVRVFDGAGNEDTATVYYHAPGRPAPPPADDEAVGELRSSNPHVPAVLISQPVRDQWPFYSEFDGSADNTFDRLPPEVAGAYWIATPRLGKPGNATRLSFRLRADSDVFVMASGAGPGPPFVETGAPCTWRDNDLRLVPCRLFRRPGAAGQRIVVPPGLGDYVVLLKPRVTKGT